MHISQGGVNVAICKGRLTLGSCVAQRIGILVLRCFMTGACDDYSNWAWWATGQAGPSGDPS
jgi:hypothetical protein